MVLKVILKSGAEFKVRCDEVKYKTSSDLDLVSYEFTNLIIDAGNDWVKPSFLDVKEVAAILRLTSD